MSGTPLKTVSVACCSYFDCELRIRNREEFQREGHMLFALYTPVPDPSKPDVRRPWNGDLVYDLRLMKDGKVLTDASGNAQHRVMSDSAEDAQRLMGELIRNQFFAWVTAENCQNFDRKQFDQLLNERTRMGAFIDLHYQAEIEAGKHQRFSGLVDLLIFYLSKERNRWSVKLSRLFRKRGKGGSVAPPDWRE